MPRVAIIILNWNGWKDTIECLESLYEIDYPRYCVIIVDNHSKDKSIIKIKKYCKKRGIKVFEYTKSEIEQNNILYNNNNLLRIFDQSLILIKNERNYGFAEGNNIGIRFALKFLNPEYILLLNNDTIVDKNFLKELIKIAERDKNIGIVAPKQFSYWNPEEVELRAHEIDFIKLIKETLFIWREKRKEKDRESDREVDWVQASCLLIKKEVIQKIGLLDPQYFISWEDLDWCITARKAGYKIIHSSKSKFWHKISKSVKKSPIVHYFKARNAFLFYKKHRDYSPLISIITTMILISEFLDVLRARNKESFIFFLRGVVDGFKLLLRVSSYESCVYYSIQ